MTENEKPKGFGYSICPFSENDNLREEVMDEIVKKDMDKPRDEIKTSWGYHDLEYAVYLAIRKARDESGMVLIEFEKKCRESDKRIAELEAEREKVLDEIKPKVKDLMISYMSQKGNEAFCHRVDTLFQKLRNTAKKEEGKT